MEDKVEHIDIRRPTEQTNIEHVHKEHPDDGVPLHKVDVGLHDPQHKVDELQQREHPDVLDLEEDERRSRDNNAQLVAEVEDNIAVPHKPVGIMLEIPALGTVGPAGAGDVLKEVHKNEVERRPPHKLDAPLEPCTAGFLEGRVLLDVLGVGVEVERGCLGGVVPVFVLVILVDNDVGDLLYFGAVLLLVGFSLFLFFLTDFVLFLKLGNTVWKLDEEEIDDDVEDDQWRCD